MRGQDNSLRRVAAVQRGRCFARKRSAAGTPRRSFGGNMFSRIRSAAIIGIDVVPVSVETDISDGLPQFTMVGYVTGQVREAGDRVRTSLKNIGFRMPPEKVTVNLAPADVLKSGSHFDLPIALGLLSCMEKVPPDSIRNIMAVGELSLSGELVPVAGILPIALKAREMGISVLIVPEENEGEGRVVSDLQILGFHRLPEVVEFLRHGTLPARIPGPEKSAQLNAYDLDFRDIRGQEAVKRAACIAAAGFHNLLMIGPPGAGKTMLARRMPTIMPPLTMDESLEISGIYSIAGLLSSEQPVIGVRPFRSPHHTLSPQALAGGGKIPKPGELTLAHRGILFLDEMPEFKRGSLEILRQPLEDREIVIARNAGTFHFPANFLLMAAMNPCPCGYYPDLNRCRCSHRDIQLYMNRISQPLLDRIDLCVECSPVTYDELTGAAEAGESSAEIREKVMRAHEVQQARFAGTGIHFNSEIPSAKLSEFCPCDEGAEKVMMDAFSSMRLSARGYHRIIKVARTIADLDGAQVIRREHAAEAVCYRMIDRKYWTR